MDTGHDMWSWTRRCSTIGGDRSAPDITKGPEKGKAVWYSRDSARPVTHLVRVTNWRCWTTTGILHFPWWGKTDFL